jgi:hypothetical protein
MMREPAVVGVVPLSARSTCVGVVVGAASGDQPRLVVFVLSLVQHAGRRAGFSVRMQRPDVRGQRRDAAALREVLEVQALVVQLVQVWRRRVVLANFVVHVRAQLGDALVGRRLRGGRMVVKMLAQVGMGGFDRMVAVFVVGHGRKE